MAACYHNLYMETTDKNTTCPKCKGPMTYQGIESVGSGASRVSNVPVYLCPQCGCNGWYNEGVLKIVEIQ